MALCSVCGSLVDEANAPEPLTYDDHAYYFCCDECEELFEENPLDYTVKEPISLVEAETA